MSMRDAMLKAGLIVRALNTDTVTFCPPLVISDIHIDRMLDIFATSAAAAS